MPDSLDFDYIPKPIPHYTDVLHSNREDLHAAAETFDRRDYRAGFDLLEQALDRLLPRGYTFDRIEMLLQTAFGIAYEAGLKRGHAENQPPF